MKIGPKYKICKRLGNGVFDKCQTHKFALSEEKHKKKSRTGKRPRALSDYGRQLIEKQKVRYTYGIAERQLSRYVKDAGTKKGTEPKMRLYEDLESRLDNVIYRTGLAMTRQMARQMVSHGHITVGGRKVTIPSYKVSKGEKIGVRQGSRSSVLFGDIAERLKEYPYPSWISFSAEKLEGEIKGKPGQDGAEAAFDLGSVLEFYSR